MQQWTAEVAVDLVELVSQVRVQQRTAEVPVESVELVSQVRVQQRTAEVPVESVKLVSQVRVQQRTAEVPVEITHERNHAGLPMRLGAESKGEWAVPDTVIGDAPKL